MKFLQPSKAFLFATLALLGMQCSAADAASEAPASREARRASQAGELPTQELPPELARVLRDYEQGWSDQDEDALAALFTADGFVMSPGRGAVRGREQIRARYENSGGPLVLRAYDYATEGGLGYILGGFATSADEPDLGKFTLLLKRDASGSWRIHSDMDNSNSRP